MERHRRSEISKKYGLPETRTFVQREPWMENAACKGMDTNIFFPERGESTKPAKAICRGCGVCAECLDHAIRTTDNRNGVQGGMSGVERRRYIRENNIKLWKAG